MKVLTTTALIALISAPAMAQELTYGAGSFDYDLLAFGGDELVTGVAEGDIEYTYNQMLFGAALQNQSLDSGGGSEDSFLSYDAFAGYMPTAETLFGLGITGASVNGENELSGYEAFGQYDNGQYAAALVYEMPDSDMEDLSIAGIFGQAALTPDVKVGAIVQTVSEVDPTFYYLSAEYDAGPVFVRGYYNGITDIDGAFYGVRASYDINKDFFAMADVGGASEFFGGNFNHYSVGAGYRINDAFVVDASFGQMELASNQIDTFHASLSYEIGQRKRLDTAMADAVRNDLSRGIGSFSPDLGVGAGFTFF